MTGVSAAAPFTSEPNTLQPTIEAVP